MTREVYYITSSDYELRDWDFVALRSTIAFLGPLAYMARALTDIPEKTGLQLLKLIHWMIGFISILWIHLLITRWYIKKTKIWDFVFFINVMLLLPANALYMKAFNYDLIAMLLAVIAALYIGRALQTNDLRLSILATVIGFLGAQEKFVAAPILLLACLASGYIGYHRAKRQKVLQLAINIGLSMIVGMSIGLLSTLIVLFLRRSDPPLYILQTAFDPLINWLRPLATFLLGSNALPSGFQMLPIIFVALCILCIGFILIYKRLPASLQEFILTKGSFGIYLLAMPIFIFGIVSTFSIDGQMHPFQPIAEQDYFPRSTFNSLTLHFGQPTLVTHTIHHTGFSYAVFTNNLPTVLWIILLATVIFRRLMMKSFRLSIFTIFVLAGFLFPALMGIVQTPISIRYQSLAMLAFTIGVVAEYMMLSKDLPSVKQTAGTIVLLLLLVIEVAPFQPFFASFRPIWASYQNDDTHVPGVRNPSWEGWGEELMLAGNHIKRTCEKNSLVVEDVPCDEIELYFTFTGEWFEADYLNVRSLHANTLSYTESEYVIVTRYVTPSYYFEDVEPAFTVTYRGFTTAWVYRGDAIGESDFRFP